MVIIIYLMNKKYRKEITLDSIVRLKLYTCYFENIE